MSTRTGQGRRQSVGLSAWLGVALWSVWMMCPSISEGSSWPQDPATQAQDTDRDGIPDEVELRTNTNPYNADTDGDGVKDGVEDANRDGVVDAGESDPRKPGLFPGGSPHIPEPMVFDMIRGMGAKRGELEVNTLMVAPLTGGAARWAPEVEWAFRDAYAVEFELPMTGRRLDALKFAVQGTLGQWDHTIHGWQSFAEVSLDDASTEVVGLYMVGHRFNSTLSGLLMAGGVAEVGADAQLKGGALLINPSIFADVREWQTLGLETNLAWHGRQQWSLGLYPQLHLQLSERVRVQLMLGAELEPEQLNPVAGTRIILE